MVSDYQRFQQLIARMPKVQSRGQLHPNFSRPFQVSKSEKEYIMAVAIHKEVCVRPAVGICFECFPKKVKRRLDPQLIFRYLRIVGNILIY